MELISFVVTFHSALKKLRNILGRIQNMLVASEEHRSFFKEQSVITLIPSDILTL